MSFYNDNQKGRPQTPFVHETGSDAEKLATPLYRCQTLIKSGSTWYLKNHNDDSTRPITEDTYIPRFRVRMVSVVGAALANVQMDLPNDNYVLESFTPGVDKPFHCTRVHLSAATTATRINLFG